MKKILFALLFTIIGIIGAYAEVSLSTAYYLNERWSNWTRRSYGMGYRSANSLKCNIILISNRTFFGLEFSQLKSQSSNWCFKFTVNNYKKPTKKVRKENLKSDTWYEYEGWVEFYLDNENPTIKSVLEQYYFPLIEPGIGNNTHLIHVPALIKIAPYKKAPEHFEIFFDNVGLGITFDEWPFDKKYVVY